MKKVSFRLDGLLNENVATKIEKKLYQAKIFEEIELDFTSKTLQVKYDRESSAAQILYEIRKIVNQIDKNITISQIIQPKREIPIQNQMKKRLIEISIAFVFFILSIEVSAHAACLVLIILSFLTVGISVLHSAVKNIIKGNVFSGSVLIAIATIGAFIIGDFTEAALVMIFFQAGLFFQEYITNRSRIALFELMDIRPTYANIKTVDGFSKTNPLDIMVGDIIQVKPGECVPLDCEIITGETTFDTSALTGDNVPRSAAAGDEVLSGFINISNIIEAKVIKCYKESAVSKTFDIIDKAGNQRAQIENKIRNLAKAYTPSVVALAAIIAILPPLLSSNGNFTTWIYRALTFLVISCHDSLLTSVPISFLSGIGGALRSGILVKKANSIETLSKIDCIAFDKTGIITHGQFEVVSVNAYYAESSKLIEMAALAESVSEHPIARAICKYYQGEINPDRVKNMMEVPGRGIMAEIDGCEVIIGNSRLMRNSNVVAPIISSTGTVIHIAVSGVYWGYIELIDKIRDKQQTMMLELKILGVSKTVILTGDRRNSAEFVAKKIGIDEVYSELLPADKVRHIENLISKSNRGKAVAFIGDGIVDAQALAAADLGMVLHGLSYEHNVETADVIIVNGDPLKICTAIKTGKNTMRIVKQNLFLGIIIKAIFLLLAANGHISMFAAVFTDILVDVITILNSIRALKRIR